MLSHAAVTASSSTSTADSLARAMAEVDGVLLIATSDFQDRMQQHQNVIDAAKAAGVKLLLGFTSRSLNDTVGPENAMMRDYLQTEALIRESGVPALIFRNALYLDTPPVSLGDQQSSRPTTRPPADVDEFVEALSGVAAGGTALDPEVVTRLMGASRRTGRLGTLTASERDGLALVAEGRSNAAIAGILVVPSGPSRSTSGTSSASSGWHPRTPTTAGC